jgi:predicted amidophosphoribosyltransferase
MTTPRTDAVWKDCAGMRNPAEHAMRDHCWNCAPYWERYPVCPDCGKPLRTPGDAGLYCSACRRHYNEGDRTA